MSKDKITPENYEGYCALFQSRLTTDEQLDKYKIKAFKAGIIPGILFVAATFTKVTNILIFLSMINFVVVPVASMVKTMIDDNKKLKGQLLSKYPNIDVNVSTLELEHMLLEAKILKLKTIDGQIYRKLDIEGYKNYIKCEKVKQEFIREYQTMPLEIEPYDVVEKEKVKVKTMNK